MKLIIAVTIVFLVSITSSISQYSPFREYQEFDWSKIEKDTTIKKKLDLIRKIIPNFYVDSSSIRRMLDNCFKKDLYYEHSRYTIFQSIIHQ